MERDGFTVLSYSKVRVLYLVCGDERVSEVAVVVGPLRTVLELVSRSQSCQRTTHTPTQQWRRTRHRLFVFLSSLMATKTWATDEYTMRLCNKVLPRRDDLEYTMIIIIIIVIIIIRPASPIILTFKPAQKMNLHRLSSP